MSGYDYSDVLDDDGFQDRQSGSGLRKQLEQVLEQNRKLIERLESKDRKDTTESLLRGKGLDPTVAEIIPEGANAEEWLAKYGHLLGGKLDQDTRVTEPEAVVAPDEDLAAEQAARARMDQGTDSAGSHVVQQQDPLAQLDAIQNEAEMLAFLDQQKGRKGSTGLF